MPPFALVAAKGFRGSIVTFSADENDDGAGAGFPISEHLDSDVR